MQEGGDALVGQPATVLAERVRRGEVTPVEVVRAHLDQIARLDDQIGAFQVVRRERALAEAEQLTRRPDLASLPLAGVPVAIKDNIPVEGEPSRNGSAATSDAPSPQDHEVVRRLRGAGAIVVGLTRVPELCIWAATDGVFGVTRNPWNLARTPGGSSGGSAAAVAAGMVPIALGNDGLGSVRIPAACCGLFGIKPGSGVVPSDIGVSSWFGMAENGPLATTADDAALMLAVLAGQPELAEPRPLDRPLRVAVSLRVPVAGVRLDPEIRAATLRVGELLRQAGHEVAQADPPYSLRYVNAIVAWWCAGTAEDLGSLDRRKVLPRTRRHAAIGRTAQRLGFVRQRDRDAWRALTGRFFAAHDLLITPALATPPIAAGPWSTRSWAANMLADTRYAPFAAPWNFAGYPAAAVPIAEHPSGMPINVQLVSARGNEALVIAAARQIASLSPRPRHAPLAFAR